MIIHMKIYMHMTTVIILQTPAKVTFTEFQSMVNHVKEIDRMAKSAFSLFDKNKDGVITAEELKSGLNQVKFFTGASRLKKNKIVKKMMAAADTDGNGVVDFK